MLAFMERMLNLPLPLGPFNKVVGSLILMLFMPLILSRLAGFLIYSMLTLFVLGPFIAFAIRARRRLADATAVQLTRNPDGLARALIHLTTLAHPICGIGWAEMLFIVGSETADHRNLERIRERAPAIRAEPNADLASRTGAALEIVHELKNLPRARRTNQKNTASSTVSTPRLTGASFNSNGWGQTSNGMIAATIPISSMRYLWAAFSSPSPLCSCSPADHDEMGSASFETPTSNSAPRNFADFPSLRQTAKFSTS